MGAVAMRSAPMQHVSVGLQSEANYHDSKGHAQHVQTAALSLPGASTWPALLPCPGTPYARRFHDPGGACACEGCSQSGRQLHAEPLFLDCCGLVRHVMRRMRRLLGFRLGPGNQAYQVGPGQPGVPGG